LSCEYWEYFNGEGQLSCQSFANKPGYGIPLDASGINMLTNRKNGKFEIEEIEVWELT
jgi:hypothetical protein